MGKESACNAGDAGDMGSIPRSGRSPGGAEMDAGEKELQGQGQGQGLGDEDVGSSSLELPAGKRPSSPALLLPPCMLKPPKRSCGTWDPVP